MSLVVSTHMPVPPWTSFSQQVAFVLVSFLISVLFFVVVAVLVAFSPVTRSAWVGGYLLEHEQFTSGCTLENMTSSPPVTINCQWRRRERWTLMNPFPIHPCGFWELPAGQFPESTIYTFPSQQTVHWFYFPNFNHLLGPPHPHQRMRSSLCDWLRGFRRWGLPVLFGGVVVRGSNSTKVLLSTRPV